MAARFKGESLNKVDSKGRVSIPAAFRRVLQAGDPTSGDGKPAGIVIVYGLPDPYLECYTIEAMEDVDDRIARLPRGSQKRRTLERIFSGKAHQTLVDEGGRLVLPAKCRDKLGLDGNAYFVATGDTFQIWHPDTFEDHESDALIDELPDGAHPLTLLEDGF